MPEGFQVIPAIDLRRGRCVRLRQGRAENETVFAGDPAAVAERWAREGASLLHVVDLDGAFRGQPVNLASLEAILKAVSVPVQFGGGLRDLESVGAVMERGVARVVLGTRALLDRPFLEETLARWPSQVLVSIDVCDGKVAVRGWTETTNRDALDVAEGLLRLGAGQVIVTDVVRDGTMKGTEADVFRRIAATGLRVVAAGGVSSLADLCRLRATDGVVGVIVGRALYEGAFTLSEALKAVGRLI